MPRRPRRQSVPLQEHYIGHAHLTQVIERLTSQTAASDHHGVRGSGQRFGGSAQSALFFEGLGVGDAFLCGVFTLDAVAASGRTVKRP